MLGMNSSNTSCLQRALATEDLEVDVKKIVEGIKSSQ